MCVGFFLIHMWSCEKDYNHLLIYFMSAEQLILWSEMRNVIKRIKCGKVRKKGRWVFFVFLFF